MKRLRLIIFGLLLALCANLNAIIQYLATVGLVLPPLLQVLIIVMLTVFFLWINIVPKAQVEPTKTLRTLSNGCALLKLFLISVTITVIFQIYYTVWSFKIAIPIEGSGVTVYSWLLGVGLAVLYESVLFWSGMIRVYLSSVQLGIKHRVLAALCGWIPGLNIYYLSKIISITSQEVETETEKFELNKARAESALCKTKYPILLVHGVFFRDVCYLNYWGRIPKELQRNGATILYGQQQSAASVEVCGKELAERIQKIVSETGCEKVNIIAHSKGGLDCRAAITHYGAAPYVATLTTINTPHQGCIFAEYLLGKVPEGARTVMTNTYNSTLKKLGDTDPDFMAAVTDLTESACLARNKTTPDASEVMYQSVMSYCIKAQSGKFPLNISYPLVRHFDGKNDGLVSVTSAKWGSNFTLIKPTGKRGISHGDMIDLNRENISGFDVREFYVSLVADLKNKGY